MVINEHLNRNLNLWCDGYYESLKGWHEEANNVQLHFADVIQKNW